MKQNTLSHHLNDLVAAGLIRAVCRGRSLFYSVDLDQAGSLVGNLSGGQKQRVAIARALVGNPDVVLADESTAALDRDSGANVDDLLKRLGQARGITTLMVTHDSRILDRANRILTLEDGRIVGDEDRDG